LAERHFVWREFPACPPTPSSAKARVLSPNIVFLRSAPPESRQSTSRPPTGWARPQPPFRSRAPRCRSTGFTFLNHPEMVLGHVGRPEGQALTGEGLKIAFTPSGNLADRLGSPSTASHNSIRSSPSPEAGTRRRKTFTTAHRPPPSAQSLKAVVFFFRHDPPHPPARGRPAPSRWSTAAPQLWAGGALLGSMFVPT